MKKQTFNVAVFVFSLMVLLLCLSGSRLYGQANPTSFKVAISGEGHPMILIPGLGCSGEVWDETVAHYQKDYQCHVLTLAGFAGQSPIQSENFLEIVRNELASYIRQQQLNKPVVVGHSLGGFVGLWLGTKEPDLIGRLVIVDSAPFLPALINPAITLDGAKAMAEGMIKAQQSQTQEEFQQTQPQVLRSMITDEANVAKAAAWNYASDGNTVGQAMYELYTTDIRAELATIKAPTLVMGAWIAYKDYGATHESTKLNFDHQYEQLPNYELVINDQAKHFIMWDDPEGFYTAMDRFLAKNK